jgi:hypothetical protein
MFGWVKALARSGPGATGGAEQAGTEHEAYGGKVSDAQA